MIETKNILKAGVTLACMMMMPQATVAASNAGEASVIKAAFIEDVGSTERINFSGKLRMLSQRIPSAACHLAAGVDPKGARTLLSGAKDEFDKILNALEFGDADLNIKGEEKRRKTLAQLHDLRGKWEPFAATVDQIVAGNSSDENVMLVIKESMSILESAKLLVSEISGQYSNPAEMTQAGALVIDIAGRQRMLTQKMSKESCAAWAGHLPGATESLAGTMQVFEASLTALTHGMPAAGIKVPPTAEIAEGLYVVNKDWLGVKDMLVSVSTGNTPDADQAAQIFHQLNATMADMNKVVVMYTAAEKPGS